MSRRRWTRKAPRRIVGSAFRSVSSIASRTAPMSPGLANEATPPRLSQHWAGNRNARPFRARTPAAHASFAMRSRSRCAPSISSKRNIVACRRPPHFSAARAFRARGKRSFIASNAASLGTRYTLDFLAAARRRFAGGGRKTGCGRGRGGTASSALSRAGRVAGAAVAQRPTAASSSSASASFGALQIAQQRNCASARCGRRCICHRSSSLFARVPAFLLLCKNRVYARPEAPLRVRFSLHAVKIRAMRLTMPSTSVYAINPVAFAKPQKAPALRATSSVCYRTLARDYVGIFAFAQHLRRPGTSAIGALH